MTNEQVKADIAANLPDNTSGLITPAKLRTEMGKMVDYSDTAVAGHDADLLAHSILLLGERVTRYDEFRSDSWPAAGGGGGSAYFGPSRAIQLTTGSTAGAFGRVQEERGLGAGRSRGAKHYAIDWRQPVLFSVRCTRVSSSANGQFFARLGGSDNSAWMPADMTARGIGFRIDGTAIKGCVHNGTTLSVVDLGISVADGFLTQDLLAVSSGDGVVLFYVNDILMGASSFGPDSVVDEQNDALAFGVRNNADAADTTIVVHSARVSCL